MKQQNLDSRDYNFYVYAYDQHKIISGNEYRNDAKDALKEFNEHGYLGSMKIFTRKHLKSIGIDANTAGAWGTDMSEYLNQYLALAGINGKALILDLKTGTATKISPNYYNSTLRSDVSIYNVSFPGNHSATNIWAKNEAEAILRAKVIIEQIFNEGLAV